MCDRKSRIGVHGFAQELERTGVIPVGPGPGRLRVPLQGTEGRGGEQLERIERLRAQLRSEGLFDAARKRILTRAVMTVIVIFLVFTLGEDLFVGTLVKNLFIFSNKKLWNLNTQQISWGILEGTDRLHVCHILREK